MAIQSMTGFGRGEAGNDSINVVVEIKSVNHRFKDIRFKMSSQLSAIEMEFRKLLTEKFKRGSFDISINIKRTESNQKFDEVDDSKVAAFLAKAKTWGADSGVELSFKPTDFIRSEFFQDQKDEKNEEIKELAKKAFVQSLDALLEARLGEGSKMVEVIKGHQESYAKNFESIIPLTETFKNSIEERLHKKFKSFGTDLAIDEPRFLQEVVYYMEKMDVHEEINRIKTHLDKLNKLTSINGEVGRQIDFLIQELNRETNTIGSKSSIDTISEAVVQMKVQLEKIREQGLNLE